MAKYVRLTIHSNWGDLLVQYGLSEVRFLYVPVWPREPEPVSGADSLSPQVTLNWRSGREAALHEVYLGTDETNLPLEDTVSQRGFEADLLLGEIYYWQIVEVNEAETPTAWAGEVWSFSTREFIVVEDFESYDDDIEAGTAIFQTWIDGVENGTGSYIGYEVSNAGTFGERAIVHRGTQAMPLFYDNDTGLRYSETERTFAEPQDWTKHGVTTLVLHFRGDLSNSAAPVYAKINGTKVIYNDGAASTALPVWKQWNIDLASTGANISSVRTLAIGVGDGSTGGTGTILVDDVLLYAMPPQLVIPADPGTNNLSALYAMEGNLQDSSGSGLHGTASGSPPYVDGLPGYGKALSLDGVSDYVDLPVGPLLSTLGSSTFATWVDISNVGNAWQRIFDFGTDTSNYMFLSPYTGGRSARFAIRTATVGEQIVNAPGPLSTGWHHMAVVIDSANMTLQLYQDGTLVSSAATTVLPKDMAMATQNWLGRSQYEADPYFVGSLDEFRIYDRALSEAEIHYLAGDR